MIQIAKLTEVDKGRKVIYTDSYTTRDPAQMSAAALNSGAESEQIVLGRQEGVLSSWNDMFVFVRFKGPNGEACKPDDVAFATP